MKYVSNGGYNISRLNIVAKDDFTDATNTIDLTRAFVSLDLYESIWENTMSGSVSLVDTTNITDLLPLAGGETIEIEFYTLGNDGNPVEYEGVIYKVGEKHRISEHSYGFTFHFVSKEALTSVGEKVQSTFSDTSDNIVKKLFSRFQSQVPLEVQPTKTISSWVFGNVQVLTAINRLAYDAHSINNEYGYVFFQNHKSFNFKPLEFLYKQKPVADYYYRNAGVYEDVSQRTVEAFNSIQEFQALETDNYLERIHDGQHGRTNSRFDLVTKSMDKFEYDRDAQYNQFSSLGNYPFKRGGGVNYNNFHRFDYVSAPQVNLDNETKSIMAKKFLKQIKAKITVFGDSFIKAGDVINATLPNWNKQQGFLKNTIDGKFLITSIRHSLSEDAYTQILTIQKDAFDEGLDLS